MSDPEPFDFDRIEVKVRSLGFGCCARRDRAGGNRPVRPEGRGAITDLPLPVRADSQGNQSESAARI